MTATLFIPPVPRARPIRTMTVVRWLSLGLLVSCTWGCGGPALAAGGPPDAPVAAGEPRETLVVELDLPRGATCEQDFDVGLYEQRAIVLVEWLESSPRCSARHARIQYLPRRLSKAALLDLLKKRAQRVTETPAANASPASAS
jgi:hypothetical protein